MAAPANKTLQDLNGNWTLNSALTGDLTPSMKLQNLNIFYRAAAGWATVSMKVTHTDKDHIQMKQFATSLKFPGTEEEYILDWEWRQVKDPLYGELESRSRWISVEDAKKEGALGEWIEDDSEGMQIQTDVRKVDGAWGSYNFMGFAIEAGARRYCRQVTVWTEDGRKTFQRLVYDFNGE